MGEGKALPFTAKYLLAFVDKEGFQDGTLRVVDAV
jgi:hypothetical protein